MTPFRAETPCGEVAATFEVDVFDGAAAAAGASAAGEATAPGAGTSALGDVEPAAPGAVASAPGAAGTSGSGDPAVGVAVFAVGTVAVPPVAVVHGTRTVDSWPGRHVAGVVSCANARPGATSASPTHPARTTAAPRLLFLPLMTAPRDLAGAASRRRSRS